jgi:hypothetical protein
MTTAWRAPWRPTYLTRAAGLAGRQRAAFRGRVAYIETRATSQAGGHFRLIVDAALKLPYGSPLEPNEAQAAYPLKA